MNSQKFKTNSFCLGEKHYSSRKNFVSEISFNKKTGENIKLLAGKCVICDRKK